LPEEDAKVGAEPKKKAWSPSPVLWVLIGCAMTLAVVIVLRATDKGADGAAEQPSSSAPAPKQPAPASLGPAGKEFAELYLAYLLRSYYVDSRGFCKNLLDAICAALLHSDLIAKEGSCYDLPNEELVLAIGRYQHKVGLPVDGKAGPETVRMILGGDFASRREMASTYCPGIAIDGPAPAATVSASQ
jgi:hypothetical protein